MYKDLQREQNMRKPVHTLSKGPWKKSQKKTVQEREVREGTEVAVQENAVKQGEKRNVLSPETNVIILIMNKF